MSETDTTSGASDAAPTAAPAPRRGFLDRLVRISAGDLVRVFFVCVLVGLALAAFRIDPRSLWVDFFGTIGAVWRRFFETLGDSIAWAVEYFLLGAVIVIPIWILVRLLGAMRRD